MANPYFNSHSSNTYCQDAYKSVTSSSGSVLNEFPQQSGVAFGLQVQQAAPDNQLNTSIADGEQLHNPFNNSRFKKVPVQVIYHQESEQTEPLDLSVKPKVQQTNESAQLHTGQLELIIDKLWRKASEASSQAHSNRAPLTLTLKDTAGNSSLALEQSTPRSSLVVDNNRHQPLQIPNQGSIGIPSESSVPMAIIRPSNIELQQNKSPEIQAEEVIDENYSHIERQRERKRERYQKDPAYAERIRERNRERYRTDPAYAERQRERNRERYRADPAYAERNRERQKERYRTDPAYAERRRERNRERYQKDPACAEGQRIYIKTYKRIKYQTSNKEVAKEQAVIARDQYLQSVNLAKNSGDLPLTSNLAETTQSSSKNLDGTTPPPLFSRQTEGIFAVPIEPISP